MVEEQGMAEPEPEETGADALDYLSTHFYGPDRRWRSLNRRRWRGSMSPAGGDLPG